MPEKMHMEELRLVHQTEIEMNGDRYAVKVFCRTDGRHVAKTRFEDDDIINDGDSLEEVLAKHESLLPLAISSRRMMKEFKGIANHQEGNS